MSDWNAEALNRRNLEQQKKELEKMVGGKPEEQRVLGSLPMGPMGRGHGSLREDINVLKYNALFGPNMPSKELKDESKLNGEMHKKIITFNNLLLELHNRQQILDRVRVRVMLERKQFFDRFKFIEEQKNPEYNAELGRMILELDSILKLVKKNKYNSSVAKTLEQNNAQLDRMNSKLDGIFKLVKKKNKRKQYQKNRQKKHWQKIKRDRRAQQDSRKLKDVIEQAIELKETIERAETSIRIMKELNKRLTEEDQKVEDLEGAIKNKNIKEINEKRKILSKLLYRRDRCQRKITSFDNMSKLLHSQIIDDYMELFNRFEYIKKQKDPGDIAELGMMNLELKSILQSVREKTYDSREAQSYNNSWYKRKTYWENWQKENLKELKKIRF
tara:strand:- start:56 stop:1216 length:1161 start_codon:yes stop_codon:yes gene_type:complete